MKISFNWLKQYIDLDLSPGETARLLTGCGLEVESIEKFESVKGGLEGMVIGEVKTKEKHPDADRLSVTTVDIGTGQVLNIVCGAANVAAGQKVVVATVGSTLYPGSGEPFQIKKSKIRGVVSEGMICAEDEIGLGTSHEGIMVLDPAAKVGTPASAYFNISSDHIFEIGLTPNRADAASHIGVARDLLAVLNYRNETQLSLKLPPVNDFAVDNHKLTIEVVVADTEACPRYSGVCISNVTVKESPAWLKERLAAIGVRSINNIVDVTNFVLHELGQPLHAFDADRIKGGKVIVKKLPAKTRFRTLDETERELAADDLMICNAESGMCIAGVFGGTESGVKEGTRNIFLESAYFDPGHIRKTARRHGLKTDASFRYERGADPAVTVYALQRAALLIKEVAGGEIASDIIDIYPKKAENFKVAFSYKNCAVLAGNELPHDAIKRILTALDITITSEGNDALLLEVPPRKVDVQREADVIEEILRIYGYDNIKLPAFMRSSLSYSPSPDPERMREAVADLLSANGFSEILTNSLTRSAYYADQDHGVKILNPLSAELDMMRQTLLYGGLEAIAYNQNHKRADLKLYEFGKVYNKFSAYNEENHLALFLCGRKHAESWKTGEEKVDFYQVKAFVGNILGRLGIDRFSSAETKQDALSQGLDYVSGKVRLVHFGWVKKDILKKFDIRQEVLYADFNWDAVTALAKTVRITFAEVARFPEVRRDLALLVDKHIRYEQLERLAYQTEKDLLKTVSLFDVYEGDKIEKNKKSYALSFIFQDSKATLTDKQVEAVMERLIKAYAEQAGAVVR
ncbi:MAG: phenylalanine--tRNA ligase subunit beta [Bacteroidota bacterium]